MLKNVVAMVAHVKAVPRPARSARTEFDRLGIQLRELESKARLSPPVAIAD
jgi:hypothetical protein